MIPTSDVCQMLFFPVCLPLFVQIHYYCVWNSSTLSCDCSAEVRLLGFLSQRQKKAQYIPAHTAFLSPLLNSKQRFLHCSYFMQLCSCKTNVAFWVAVKIRFAYWRLKCFPEHSSFCWDYFLRSWVSCDKWQNEMNVQLLLSFADKTKTWLFSSLPYFIKEANRMLFTIDSWYFSNSTAKKTESITKFFMQAFDPFSSVTGSLCYKPLLCRSEWLLAF